MNNEIFHKYSQHLPFILSIHLSLSFFVSTVDVVYVGLWWSRAGRLSPPREWHTCSIVRPLCIIAHSHTNRAAKVALSPVNYLGRVITCLFGSFVVTCQSSSCPECTATPAPFVRTPQQRLQPPPLHLPPLLNHFRLYLPFRPAEGLSSTFITSLL